MLTVETLQNEFKVRQLSTKEYEFLDSLFNQEVYPNPELREEFLKVMFNFFNQVNEKYDYRFRNSFFKWFTLICFKQVVSLDEEMFLNMLIARQLPLAAKLGLDIYDTIMFYLNTKYFIENDKDCLKNIFSKIKKKLMNSQAIISFVDNNPYVLSDLWKQLVILNQQNADTLKYAEFRTSFKEMFVGQEKYKSIIGDEPEYIINRLLNFISFVIGVDVQSVYYFVFAFAHPFVFEKFFFKEELQNSSQALKINKLDNLSKKISQTVNNTNQPITINQTNTNNDLIETKYDASLKQVNKQEKTDVNFQIQKTGLSNNKFEKNKNNSEKVDKSININSEKPAEQEPVLVANVELEDSADSGLNNSQQASQQQVDYKKIKEQIEKRFLNTLTGKIENIQGLLSLLEILSKQYNDPNILSLYYFDEQERKFKWNNELLK